MSRTLRNAWQSHITAADYDRHMAAVGQAQANAAIVEWFVRERLHPGARVLVPGAGTGQLLDFVASGLFEAFDVTFTDVSPQLLAQLQARIAGRHLARVTTLVDDIERTALPGPYDAAIVVLVLEHTDWRRVIGTLAGLRTALCLVVVQRNPPVPVAKPLAGTLAILHDVPFTLVDPDEVGREFAVHGYEMVATDAVDVPDQKQMLALVFGRRHGV